MSLQYKVSERQLVQTATLVLAVGIVGSNGLLLSPILPDVARSYGTSTLSISRAISTYGGATALSALLLAPNIDRIGPRRALVMGMLCLLVALLGSALAPQWLGLAAAQGLAGLGAGVILPASYALATMIAPSGQEARFLGRVLIGWSLSLVAGVPASAFIAQSLGWRVSYFVLAAICAVAMIGILRLPEREKAASPAKGRGLLGPLRHPMVPLLLFVCLSFTTAFYGVYAFLADDIRQTLSISAGRSGLVVLAYGVGFAVGAFLNVYVDRLGTRRALPAALLANALTYIAMAHATHDFLAIVIVAVVWGVVAHLCLNMIVLLLSRAKPEERGAVLGLNSAMTYLGAMVGTAVAGAIYTGVGFEALAWCAALPPVLAALLLIFNRPPAQTGFMHHSTRKAALR